MDRRYAWASRLPHHTYNYGLAPEKSLLIVILKPQSRQELILYRDIFVMTRALNIPGSANSYTLEILGPTLGHPVCPSAAF